ncbi:MAG: drug/metabolite transporter (DMT)-like permease [Arenicella sp.]
MAGDLLKLLAIAFYGVYSVMLSKKPAMHWLSLISVLSLAVFFSSLPFSMFESLTDRLTLSDKTGELVVLYAALCLSLLSQVFWVRGIELIGSDASSLLINLVPILGALLALILLDETPNCYHVLGLVFIINGIQLTRKMCLKLLKPCE